MLQLSTAVAAGGDGSLCPTGELMVYTEDQKSGIGLWYSVITVSGAVVLLDYCEWCCGTVLV